MHYLLFNNDILMSDGTSVRRIGKGDEAKDTLRAIERASLCVVDVDMLIAAAVEAPVERKDSILVRKFKELYQHEAYIIQDERLDNNLFQVMGIKEQKVREVYALVPPQKVESFVPYGMALRHTLMKTQANLNKTIVFVDDLGQERLLTVFDGYKFSRTRMIANNGEDILPEIKRSQIDFFKKTEEFLSKKNADFVIMVNNPSLAGEISKNKEKLQVEHLPVAYPALEGLKDIHTAIKYGFPEEIFKKRREMEMKKNAATAMASLSVVVMGLLFFLFNRIEWGVIHHQYELARRAHQHLDEKLQILDKETYRQDLKDRKSLNYGVFYLSVLDMIPVSYTVNSFKFCKTGQWDIEMTLSADDDGFLDPIPRIKILRNAQIKDIFVNNQPGKHLQITL